VRGRRRAAAGSADVQARISHGVTEIYLRPENGRTPDDADLLLFSRTWNKMEARFV
jgi:hypothetical protein